MKNARPEIDKFTDLFIKNNYIDEYDEFKVNLKNKLNCIKKPMVINQTINNMNQLKFKIYIQDLGIQY